MRSHAKAASVFVSLVMLLGVVAPSALAAPAATTGYSYLASFGGGELVGPSERLIGDVAVESGTGNILVGDQLGWSAEKNSVDVFAPDSSLGGVPLTGFNAAKTATPSSIATDPSTGAVYIVNSAIYEGSPALLRFVSDGAPTPTYTQDPTFVLPVTGDGIVVDPTTHDLLVNVTGGGGEVSRVVRYDSATGAQISSFDTGVESSKGIAVGPDGSIYVDQRNFPGSSGGPPRIKRFNSDGTLAQAIDLSYVPKGIAVNPVNGTLVIADEGRLHGYTPEMEPLFETVSANVGYFGLAIDGTSGRLYSFDGTAVHTFVAAPYPGVEAPVASAVTATGFHVETEVDPGEKEGGGLPDGSEVRFEYRLAGTEEWVGQTPGQPVGAAGTYGADISGLGPNFTYEVRAVAFNSQTAHNSEITKVLTLGTPPIVNTSAATDVTEVSAVLNGSIDPIGLQTTYHFEYGTSTNYGSRIPAGIEAVAGGGHEVRAFSRSVAGLQPGTTYHFRLVATNSVGTTEGADRTFTTVAIGGTPPRYYEQVTPAEKNGATLKQTLGFQAEADGEGLAYFNLGGPLSSPLQSRWLSRRGADDWQGNLALDPPLDAGNVYLVIQNTLAVSDDFDHTFVVSNKALAPGAIEGNDTANLYVVDLATGEYQLVASSNAKEALATFTGFGTGDKYMAGAPDLSWIVFNSKVPMLPGAPADTIYRWSEADGLEVVSALPDGDMTPVRHKSAQGEERTVSADGSRIYFSAFKGSEEGVFLREGDGVKAISVSHISGDPETPQPATFLGMSKDGRFAFFGSMTSGAKLTDDAPGEIGDLYRYDASDDGLEYLGVQADVQIDGAGRLQNGTLGTADDGGTFYFKDPVSGDLSVWRNGVTHSVASFSGPWSAGIVFISPNGRYAAFPATAEGGGSVRLYDAETNQLSCASCLPDGSPGSTPAGFSSLPSRESFASNRLPQAVDNSGTVYFTGFGRLVAADVNGTADVYGYRDGSAFLVSPGNGPFDAYFGDISEDGRDVFFTTAQKLVGRDNDEAPDVYDARIGGGLPAQSPPPPQECLRDDCKATPNSGPELPFGGSEALSGPGNVSAPARKRCPKGSKARKVKGKTRCVKKSKAKKSAHRTGASRRHSR